MRPPALTILILALAALVAAACQGPGTPSTVVYTSLDQPFSEPVLEIFEQQTGITVRAVYDVEAAKTTGLVNRLIAERERPQADVFWSSEYAQTLLLKERGLLVPYASPSAADIPVLYRDADHYWTGFAARARVIIVNTRLVPPDRYPQSIFDLLDHAWGKGEVGIANPLFGTTATHAAALFAVLGPDRAKAFFQALRDRGARVVAGNSVVRDMVVTGELSVGLTDTDDAFIAVAKGQPVKVILPDQNGLGTLLIPNTVALLKQAPHPEEGRRLVDYLLSLETEARLARAASRQIPLREAVASPPGAPRLRDIRAMAVRPADVAGQMSASAAWLRQAFLR